MFRYLVGLSVTLTITAETITQVIDCAARPRQELPLFGISTSVASGNVSIFVSMRANHPEALEILEIPKKQFIIDRVCGTQ